VGAVLARHLLQYFGEPSDIFSAKQQTLERVPGIGTVIAEQITAGRADALRRAEREIRFINRNSIRCCSMLDKDYPVRLRETHDAPVVFYFRGNGNWQPARALSIVGTRHATEYGREMTVRLIKGLAATCPDVVIVSGLAYGIDVCAHRAAVMYGLPTIGVLAHGLDRIYPVTHRPVAIDMLRLGGLFTDYTSGSKPEREHFLQRNRLIAGLTDATVVVESGEHGGSLVTASIACSYGRDVYTFPGRVHDEHSVGCNRMIQHNKAGLITSAEDLIREMSWDTPGTRLSPEQRLPFRSEPPDHPLLALLHEKGNMHVDELSRAMKLPVHQITAQLFELEMDGHVQATPGNMYRLTVG
jgi:DNA processing protein